MVHEIFKLTNPTFWLADLFSTTQLDQQEKADLCNHYLCGRTYHGLFHLAFLWQAHCIFNRGWMRDVKWDGIDPDIRMANLIVSHDVIMAKDDSEKQSAQWWLDHQRPAMPFFKKNLTPADVQWVHHGILATEEHFIEGPGNDPDTMLLLWFLGLDLLPLAAPEAMFDQNRLMIRAENPDMTDAEFVSGTEIFLRKILARPIIFQHPALRQFEGDARSNIQRTLAK